MPNSWSEEELRFLRKNYRTMAAADIAREIGRTPSSVRSMMHHKGLKRSDSEVKRFIRYGAEKSNRDRTGQDNPNWKHGKFEGQPRKEYRRNNPRKWSAHYKVHAAIQRGDLERRPCIVCGKTNDEETIHAHHEDYEKPLDVLWLCANHHMKLHHGLIDLDTEVNDVNP